MRLKQIKLAGFKSFVDPTNVPFPENLTAIVGPNGCGKSNLIDAVRWVMGESSAKNLRGESMTDVIFNGSTSRKPVGQASIELVFDNTDGTVQGEYANYAEISIRRTVTREAQASYYLNGTKCRRRDITDIFLGTGLGPRSYSIIEQGMISRLIESKPQELRVFLEEAAGISKYKERRRETENRIRHTRENMERLVDIREELIKQIAHLQRQANAAMRYKALKKEERRLERELSALRWKKFHSEVESLTKEINELEVELAARVAQQRRADAQIEQARERHIKLTNEFNSAQGNYYSVGADIARLEQSIAHKKERRKQINDDLLQVSASLEDVQEQVERDEERVEDLQEKLLDLEPESEIQQQRMEQAEEFLTEIESVMLDWEAEWDEFNKTSADNRQKVEVERTRIQHFERVIERLLKQIESTNSELKGLLADPLEEAIVEASTMLGQAEEEVQTIAEAAEVMVNKISQLRDARRKGESAIALCRREHQKAQSQYISLTALQKAALGANSQQLERWLEANQLKSNSRLAQVIKVDPGWEQAVEVVLGGYLDAVTVDGFDNVIEVLDELVEGSLTLLNQEQVLASVGSAVSNSLLSKVQHGASVSSILANVVACDSLESALAYRHKLSPLQSAVTPDGIWIGANWIRISRKEANELSILERQVKLEALSTVLRQHEARLEELNEKAVADGESLKELELSWEHQQRHLAAVNKRYTELSAQVGSQRAELEQLTKRKVSLSKAHTNLTEQLRTDEQLLSKSRGTLETLVDAMADDMAKKERLNCIKEEKRIAVEQARSQVQQSKDQAHQIELQVANIQSEINSIQSTGQRMQRQLDDFKTRKLNLEESLQAVNAPDDELQIELEEALEKRLESEQVLASARASLEEVDKKIRLFEKDRHGAEQLVQSVRDRLEKLKMKWSESSTMQKNQANSLSGDEQEIASILNFLEEQATEEEWQSRLESVVTKIQRLGAINLAAIEEHAQQSERKVYLDAQYDDLAESLQTLETAIRKIDKETRTRFKETFDKVNSGMQELFPKVFGGGNAYLELTGEDLLDAGVTVMARPPGKRNSTIHLLSGGEKALTALSLVFSIFRLNPAPFCMLDEVDAPLDDANVGRFCKLVKDMSKTVQFIYITHNKVTMEMASALAGVTMQEPGVSRLVAVDVDEAAQLIA